MTREPTGAKADKPETTRSGIPMLTIDWDLYGEYLEDADLTDDQKRDLIETLWAIVVGFVDLGFGIHPLQQAAGQSPELANLIAAEAPDAPTVKPSLTSRYADVIGADTGTRVERQAR